MTNPLRSVEARSPRMSPQEWVDRGNAILAGHMAMERGDYAGQFMRRDDVRWFLENGRPVIGTVR